MIFIDFHPFSLFGRAAALFLPSASKVWLLEKFPEHVFRLPLLRRLLPGCRVLHLVRRALPVARSIATFAPSAWYGARDAKWRQLLGELQSRFRPGPALLEALEEGPPQRRLLARGLVEWALSECAAEGEEVLRISYEHLVAKADEVLDKVEVRVLHIFQHFSMLFHGFWSIFG